MLIYMVRHGQTETNAANIFAGHLDVALTDLGITQAQKTGNMLQSCTFNTIYSSDLSRAYNTTNHIITTKQSIITTPLLRERNYHNYEGVPRELVEEHAQAQDMTLNEYIQLGGTSQFPIESSQQLIQRWHQFIEQYASSWNQNDNILIVSHGGFIRIILARILTSTPEQSLGISQLFHSLYNASISIIQYNPDSKTPYQLITYNEHSHLLNLT